MGEALLRRKTRLIEGDDTLDAAALTTGDYTNIKQKVEIKQKLNLTAVKYKARSTGNHTLRIWNEAETELLHEQIDSISNANAFHTFELGDAIKMLSGTNYHFQFLRPSAQVYRPTNNYIGTVWDGNIVWFGGDEFSNRCLAMGLVYVYYA